MAKKDCKTTALGSRMLVPSPAEPRLRAPSRVPIKAGKPAPSPWTSMPDSGTERDTTQKVTVFHGLQSEPL